MQYRLHTVIGVSALTAFAACGGGEPAQEQPPAEPPPPPAEQGGGAAMELPAGVTAAMVAQGDTIFHNQGLCFTCHGPDAKGTTIAPDLTDDTWLNITARNYDEIVGVVTTGVAQPKQHPAPMAAKGGSTIGDEQVRAVAAYVYTLNQR